MKSNSIFVLALFSVTLLAGAHSAYPQDRHIYWIGTVDPAATQANTIFRSALNTGVVDTLVHSVDLGPEDSVPRYFYYVTVDTIRGHIYWTDSGGEDPESNSDLIGAVRRADLNGDNLKVFSAGAVCGLGGPTGIDVDTTEGALYWGEDTDCYDAALHRTDLISPESTHNYLPVRSGYHVGAIDLDIQNQMIYWVSIELFGEIPGIVRAPVNDTVSDEYIITGCIGDIALAHQLAKIYWTPCNSNQIKRSNLDGSEVEDILNSTGEIGNLAIDHKGGKIYWSETEDGRIRRSNLDGSESEDLLTDLLLPGSLALDFGWDVHLSAEPEAETPDRIELKRIYPNPVRKNATIEFILSEPTHVTVEIYDQLGRRVSVLASAPYVPGTFHVEWNPADEANGVYFCRLSTDFGSETIVLALQR